MYSSRGHFKPCFSSFYPLLSVSTVVINFPSVRLKFSIAFPFFSHCFTSYSLICSLFIMAWRLHCLQNCGKNWTSAHHMCVISSWIPQQTKRMRFIIDGQKYDFSVFEVRGENWTSAHHMCIISSWIPQQTRRMRFIIGGQKYDQYLKLGQSARQQRTIRMH